MPDFSLLNTPNFAQAALGGYQAGRQIGQQKRTDEALSLYAKDPVAGIEAISALDPERGEKLKAATRERQASEAASRALVPNADPNAASPLTINREALGDLAKLDPKMALGLQEFALKADKAQQEQVAAHLAVKANAADALLALPPGEQRQQAFEQLRPQLLQQGFTEAELAQADLSDNMLLRDKLMGLTFEQRLKAQDTAADNARQDKTAENTIMTSQERLALARRADARSSEARSEGRVRFRERDKDRAAIAAGGRGIPTDLSDLDY